MPTLRIQFPERDTPTTLALSGNRITIGRRADNTVQIVDRMVSAFHAELILEGDHYRLHDLGSTNGTRVNGDPVMDFHLREACKIGFGPVECEFSAETAAAAATEKLPTRIEVESTRRQCDELRSKLSNMSEELEALRKAGEAGGDEAGSNLLKGEVERLVRERAAMQESMQQKEREFEAIKTELARMNRDRQNLQTALSQANAEIAHLKSQAGAATQGSTPVATPAAPAKTAETSAPTAAPEKKAPAPAGLPKPSTVTSSDTLVSPPLKATPAPAQPSQPSAPRVAPAGLPKPTARPAGVPASGAPRPIARPAVATSQPGAGPSGTQKISVSAHQLASATTVKLQPAKPTGLPRLGSLPKPTAVPGSDQPSSS
jgi:hypothetical protein